jgi:tetratricopeptide (TPR) repeat protein
LVGGEEWGIARLLQHLVAGEPTLWLKLNARHLDNPQAQAQALLEALPGQTEVAYADLPLALGTLEQHLSRNPQQVLVFSGAEYAPHLVEPILERTKGHRVLMWFGQAPWRWSPPRQTTWITPDELALSFEEAWQLARPTLPATTAQTLLKLSQGALERFITLCHQHLKLPPPTTPAQTLLPGVVEALLERSDTMGALELITRDCPHLTPLLLQRLEYALHLYPEPERVYSLLQGLAPELRQHPVVARWRLESALQLGRHLEVMGEVSTSLYLGVSPELRATYAEALYHSGDMDGFLHQAKQAAQHSMSPQVLFSYGRALDLCDPQQGRTVLLQAIQQAEQNQSWFWAVQAALALAQGYTTLGVYPQAVRWAEWGLRTADKHNVQARHSRRWLLNEWAYARMMSGETLGLEVQLLPLLDQNPQQLNYFLRSTLGDVLLAQGNPQQALEVYWPLWHTRRPSHMAALSNIMVRAMLEVGHHSQALEIATAGVAASQGLHKVQRRRATLALGMVLAQTDPARAVSILRQSLSDLQNPLLAHRLTQAGLYLALAYVQLGQTEMARTALKTIEPTLEHLGPSGLRYLSGDPAVFRPVLELRDQMLPRLELHFLGQTEVRLDGTPLRLGNRACELLAVLALHPQGLSAEALSKAIYGSTQESETIPVLLSGLKGRGIPIQSRPYRLGLEVWADFLELPKLLRQNRTREALSLLQGSLLPRSESPLIRFQHEQLFKAVRDTVLGSQDLEALLALAQDRPGDAELWNQAMALMPPFDPRRSTVELR